MRDVGCTGRYTHRLFLRQGGIEPEHLILDGEIRHQDWQHLRVSDSPARQFLSQRGLDVFGEDQELDTALLGDGIREAAVLAGGVAPFAHHV